MASDSEWDRPYPRELWEAFERRLDRWERRWKRRQFVNTDEGWQRVSDWEATPKRPERLPTRQSLLEEVASTLLAEARQYVPRVLPDKPDAAPKPLGSFILAQGQSDPEAFQLPEPLLGPIGEQSELLVVGLNPGYNPEEDIPRLSASLDEYVEWYANRMVLERRDQWRRPMSRFSGMPGLIRHYWAIERDYLDPVFGPQSLGRRAVYVDAIPWKRNAEVRPDLNDTAVLRYARARVAEIASVLEPRLLLTLGVFAASAVGIVGPQTVPSVIDSRVGYWQGKCLALFHPNKRWPTGTRAAYLAAARQRLQEVVSSQSETS
jgi:hypothetical protein